MHDNCKRKKKGKTLNWTEINKERIPILCMSWLIDELISHIDRRSVQIDFHVM